MIEGRFYNLKTFVIQGKMQNGNIIPAQSYGYTAIEAVEYANWYNCEQVYDYVLLCPLIFKDFGDDHGSGYNYLTRDHIPIGSVEFVLEWLKQMKAPRRIHPLNIPVPLWHLVHRGVEMGTLSALEHKWRNGRYAKDLIHFKKDVDTTNKLDKTQYFQTEYIEEILSEWRVFVYNKEILGIRCYAGDEWVLPDKTYIEDVIKQYGYSNNPCYTLDVMVYRRIDEHTKQTLSAYRGNHYTTDIVEIHDFFACGLYGFEDLRYLPLMWIATINKLLDKK